MKQFPRTTGREADGSRECRQTPTEFHAWFDGSHWAGAGKDAGELAEAAWKASLNQNLVKKLASAVQAVVSHANNRQRIATAGFPIEEEELHRIPEPEFVQECRQLVVEWNALHKHQR